MPVGFTVHAPILDVHLGSLNRKSREGAWDEVRDSLDLARDLEASVVVVHGASSILTMPGGEWSKLNYRPGSAERELVLAQESYLVQAMKELADYAPDLLLALENLVFPHELYRSPEQMRDLIAKVNRSNVGFALDAGHALVCGYRALDYLDLLEKQLLHVHLHDNHGTVDEHLPLGAGVLDYVGLLQVLKKRDYLGVVTLEFSLEDPRDFAQYLF